MNPKICFKKSPKILTKENSLIKMAHKKNGVLNFPKQKNSK